MLLSFGFGLGRLGGRVNEIDVLVDFRFGLVEKETEEREDSIGRFVRWAL